ncbi:enoyl-CoA hydratase/isomerase family protein [Sagittula sp. NFXS13]|uniref:enoyl-CoA hydratase/isomerase family protein n=1 Tax=Sagittula sp. NFXS13 TaxID=2819095 RepID=UPI0032DE3FFE
MTDLDIRIDGRVGRITLTRPKALNALTHDMCLKIEAALAGWVGDDTVRAVLIDGAGEKAFCAGGDVIALYEEGLSGRDSGARQFWRDEYRLNAMIAEYPKPFIALMDGIVMGGGVGVSAHGSHRIVTERTVFAMPECVLGLIPDVGGTHLLAQMPGHAGEYVGLTGTRLAGADCLHGGLADYVVPSDRLDALVVALCAEGDPACIQSFAADPGASSVAELQGEIDAVFGQADIAAIRAMLSGAQSEFAQKASAALDRGAPVALCATLEAIRAARAEPSLRAALAREYRFVSRALIEGDFVEGVRARLLDKTNAPRWKITDLSSVSPEVRRILGAPAPEGDLVV